MKGKTPRLIDLTLYGRTWYFLESDSKYQKTRTTEEARTMPQGFSLVGMPYSKITVLLA